MQNEIEHILGNEQGNALLERFPTFRGIDCDEAANLLSCHMHQGAWKVTPTVTTQKPRIEFKIAQTPRSVFGYAYSDYAHDVNNAAPTSNYTVLMPLHGNVTYRRHSEVQVIGPGRAVVYSPGAWTGFTKGADTTCLAIAIAQETFTQLTHGGLRVPLFRPEPFIHEIDLASPEGRLFATYVGATFRTLDRLDEYTGTLILERLEEIIWLDLANLCADFYRGLPGTGDSESRPRHISRAVDYVMANTRNEIKLSDLVGASGIGARSLQTGFNRIYGVGPMAFIRRVKLGKTREQLLHADPATTKVSDVAAHWGFFHASNFSVCYSKEFGELPSATLQRIE